jgi:hypothetical protein
MSVTPAGETDTRSPPDVGEGLDTMVQLEPFHCRAGMAEEMAVNQGLVEPFSGPNRSLFGLYKPNSGGGGWVRTSDARLVCK